MLFTSPQEQFVEIRTIWYTAHQCG